MTVAVGMVNMYRSLIGGATYRLERFDDNDAAAEWLGVGVEALEG